MAVDVVVADEEVVVRFSGLERLLTLKGTLRLPMGTVRSARVAPVDQLRSGLGWELAGTHVPGLVTAGSFPLRDGGGGRQLWCVQRDDEALVVELEPLAGQPYRRVVLQHPDRHDLAWWIGERVPTG